MFLEQCGTKKHKSEEENFYFFFLILLKVTCQVTMQSGASSSTEEDGLVEFGNPKNTKSSTRNTIISTGLIVLLGVALTLVLVYFLIFAEKENTIDYVDGSSLSSWEKMLLDEVSSCRLRFFSHPLTNPVNVNF